MPKKFITTPDSYNEFNVLKIPLLFIVVLIYLNKYFLLVVFPGLPVVGGIDLSGIAKWFKIDALMMLSCLPALAVLFTSLYYRVPTAKKWQKSLWHNSGYLLLLSTTLDILILSLYIGLSKRALDEGTYLLFAIDFGIIVYLLRSEYLKEMFKEFPEEIEKKK